MPAALLAADEPQRIATLQSYEILDTLPERSFDRLVQLAAEHFDVPISLVSLIDADRQWFKAGIGLDLRQTPRDQAFCAHAILDRDQVMVVEDATIDPRFLDNPLVLDDPSIRFYAGAPICAENGQPLGTLCVIDRRARKLDASGRRFLANLAANVGSMLELHRKNLILTANSGRDPLTGLANRRVFDTALAAACAAADSVPFGLLALDLDHFKAVNDELGHEVGDNLLREVALRLGQLVRGRDLIARLGGDEFAIIVAGPIDRGGLLGLARRVMELFMPDMVDQGHAVPIRTSIGIALAPLHGTDPRLLSRAADFALYSSKRAGRQAITMALAPDDQADPKTPTLADDLRQAIRQQTLQLYWQPYFAATSGNVVGYEALLRWLRVGHDPVSPTEMVAMAEQGGFIADLDRMVLLMACTQAASWPRPLTASVNLSASWFDGGDLVGLIGTVLAQTGLSPRRLTIELTEGTLVRHTESARERIAGLHAMGVRIALDDFGTGYASLGYLCSFAFDKLKLDRTFVQGLGRNPRAEAVARAVIALGKALDMAVCAEGVETEDQLFFLQEAGCNLIQGFLLGRPQATIAWPRIVVEDATTPLAQAATAA